MTSFNITTQCIFHTALTVIYRVCLLGNSGPDLTCQTWQTTIPLDLECLYSYAKAMRVFTPFLMSEAYRVGRVPYSSPPLAVFAGS